MSLRLYLTCVAALVLLFGGLMVNSLIIDELRPWFGDIYTPGKKYEFVNDGYQWGARHFIYYWFSTFMFLLSLISAIIHIVRVVNKEAATKNH